LGEYAEMNTHRVEQSARKRLRPVSSRLLFQELSRDFERKLQANARRDWIRKLQALLPSKHFKQDLAE
jgi:hypothetical protein